MSVIFNEKGVSAEELPGGVRRQRLIDADRVEGAVCRFDRLAVEAGGGA